METHGHCWSLWRYKGEHTKVGLKPRARRMNEVEFLHSEVLLQGILQKGYVASNHLNSSIENLRHFV